MSYLISISLVFIKLVMGANVALLPSGTCSDILNMRGKSNLQL